MYARIEKSDRIRKAADLTQSEIERVFAEYDGDTSKMAAKLEVSRPALQRRMKQLDMS